jgi:hypothetical protein
VDDKGFWGEKSRHGAETVSNGPSGIQMLYRETAQRHCQAEETTLQILLVSHA